nr:hypothetical protein [Halococcus saccharolyticus]
MRFRTPTDRVWGVGMTDEYVHDPEAFEDTPRSEYDEAAARGENRSFDWRGWALVGVIVFAFLIAPGLILAIPYAGGTLSALGLTWRDTFLVLPLLPALALGLTAVWAASRA